MKIEKQTKILLECLRFPEGPRWHDNKLWFSDMVGGKVMTVDLEGNAETIIKMRGSPSGLGWDLQGKLLIVSMLDRRLLRLESDGLKEVANLKNLASNNCNDMVVDKNGNAYIGNFGFDFLANAPFKPAELILVTPDGQARIVADNMAFPNGTIITPDGSTLIVGETYGSCLTAFNIEKDASLTNRRIWARLSGNAVPDGICLDSEGAIWVASPTTSEVLRVLEGGEVTNRIKIQGENSAFACMLGGPSRKTLFICTSNDSRTNGRIEIIEVDYPGAGLP
jgi:sugar lactone lactonase YvrE